MTRAALIELGAYLEERAKREAEREFAAFVRQAWHVLEPSTPLVWGWHLDVVCAYLQALWERRLRAPRLIINIPPGTSKSRLVSVLWPAWVWVQATPERPHLGASQRILSASNDGPLVLRDNLAMRLLVTSEWYQRRWGDRVRPDSDQWEKGYFQNQALGFRQGVTIKGSVTGKRGDIQIIDDPHDARKAFSDVEIASAIEAWDQGMSTRVNDMERSLRVLIMQRLRVNDLTGHLLSKSKQDWVHVRIPMEYPGRAGFDPVRDIGPEAAHLADPRQTVGELLDPVRFPASAVAALKEDLGEYGSAGQLAQEPTPLSGGVLKRRWWRLWGRDGKTKGLPLPHMLHVFASWDTAFSERELRETAFSAKTRWGVFWDEDRRRHALMLLGAWYQRCDWPDLVTEAERESAERLINSGDAHLIERKASGISLAQHLRRNRKLTIRTYDPAPDGDKVARAYLAQRLLKSGLVWLPGKTVEGGEVVPLGWAADCADLVATFPTGQPPSADLTDTVTQALLYLERRHWVHHPDDDLEAKDDSAQARERWDDSDDDQPAASRVGYG